MWRKNMEMRKVNGQMIGYFNKMAYLCTELNPKDIKGQRLCNICQNLPL